MSVKLRGIGLTWKITGSFVGVIMLLGLLVVGSVYHLAGSTLRGQLNRHSFAITTNLSDGVAGFVLRKRVLQLSAAVTKYARLEGVAYVFVEDSKGEIIAHSLGAFPEELSQPLNFDQRRETLQRELMFEGRTVYETRIPILEGQVGVVRMGFWGDAVEKEIQIIIQPIVWLISLVFLVGVLVSVLLAHSITRPILGLTRVAEKISKGDLDTAVDIRSRDEIGGLADSLERMRSSLKAAMSRLNLS